MLILHSPEVAQETAYRWKKESRIAFVPTMGCLHAGHRRLVEMAKEYADKIVVSIFVNPLQFGPQEDFDKYPRPFEDDCKMLEELGVDLVLAPGAKDLYPDGFVSRVQVPGMTDHLCGKSRPGHFEGVATVCLKLFHVTLADYAVFGMKDFQQLRVIQQMTSDLNLPLTILPHPTIRESDGLALSSRNRYLSPQEREWAAQIPKVGRAIAQRAQENSQHLVGDLTRDITTQLTSVPLTIDYVVVASERDLIPVASGTTLSQVAQPRAFVAVRVGSTRLIDNWSLEKAEL